MDFLLPRGFDASRDVLLHLHAHAGRESATLYGNVPEALRGATRALRLDGESWPSLVLRAERVLDGALQAAPELGQAIPALLEPVQRAALHRALMAGNGIRWVLCSEPNASTSGLPWELWWIRVRGRARGEWTDEVPVALGRARLVRWIAGGEPPLVRPAPDRFRVLVLVGSRAQPGGTFDAAHHVATELAAIEQALRSIPHAPLVFAAAGGHAGGREVERIDDRASLERLLQRGFHLVHYLGHASHGAADGDGAPAVLRTQTLGLRFDEPLGLVKPDEVARALQGTPTRLLVLHACRVDGHFARELARGVDQIVVMQAQVTAALTETWAAAFYAQVLGRPGTRVSEALCRSREALGDLTKNWIPAHWSTSLADNPFPTQAQYALAQHRERVQRDHASLGGILAEHFLVDDALGQLYVELEVEPRADGKLLELAGGKEPRSDRLTLGDLVRRKDSGGAQSHWLLVSDAGTGKTTSLKKLARDLAAEGEIVPWFEDLASWHQRGIPGTFIDLVEDHRRSGRPAPDSDSDSRPSRNEEEARNKEAKLLRDALEAEMQDGRLVVLLDGLDEAPDDTEAKRRAVRHFVNHLRGLPGLRLIVATRPLAFQSKLPAGFTARLRLKELDRDQQLELLTKWFTAERKTEPQRMARELRAYLEAHPTLTRVASVPLYLALAAMLWAQGQPPKTDAHLLYQQCIEYLLYGSHRAAAPEEAGSPPRELCLELLHLVALDRTLAGRDSFRTSDLENLLHPTAKSGLRNHRHFRKRLEALGKRVSQWSCPHPRERGLLWWIAAHTGILSGDRASNAWSFPLRTFREALAAEALKDLYAKLGLFKLRRFQSFVSSVVPAAAAGATHEGPASGETWGEVLSLLTGWLAESDRDAWVRWLVERYPRFGYRALAFAPGVSAETVVAVLGSSTNRFERWSQYERLVEAARPDSKAVGAQVQALAGALARVRLSKPDTALARDAVGDVARLDAFLADLGETDIEEVRRARAAVLSVAGSPTAAQIAEQFLEIPGRGGPHWARVPAGTFTMGSPETEEGRLGNEEQVEVTLGRAFWTARVPVTLGQYRLFDPRKEHRWGEDELLPVTDVTWYESALFCRWLEHHGAALKQALGAAGAELCFRLPTEAEWEYCCRDAGTRTTRFVSGDSEGDLERVAWYWGNSGRMLHPVATKDPSPELGLHDMHGNVWEWCGDWYADRLRGGRDPAGPPAGAGRVLRGGSYWYVAQLCRSAFRDWSGPGHDFDDDFGFRVVLAPSRPLLGDR